MKIQRKTTNSRWRAPWKTALLALGIYATQATSQQTLGQVYPGYGNGTISHHIPGGVTEYTDDIRTEVVMTNSPMQEVQVTNIAGFNVGQRILVIQMESCSGGCSAGTNFVSTITSINFFTNTLTLTNIGISMPFFCTGGMNKVQAMVIPEWLDMNIDGTYTCHAWDGFTGGVLCFYVKNLLTVNPGGLISADFKGYFNNLAPGIGGPGAAGDPGIGGGGAPAPSSPPMGMSNGFDGIIGGDGMGQPGMAGILKCPQFKGGDGGRGGNQIMGFPGTPGMMANCSYPFGLLIMGNSGQNSGDGGKGGNGGGAGGGGGGSLNPGFPGFPGGAGGMGGNGGGPEGPGAGSVFIKAQVALFNNTPSVSARGGNGMPGMLGGAGGQGGNGGNGSDDLTNVGAGGGGGFGWRGNGANGGGGSDAGSGSDVTIVTTNGAPVIPPPTIDMSGGIGGEGGEGGDPYPIRALYGNMGHSTPDWFYCPTDVYLEICDCENAYKALANTNTAYWNGSQMVFTDNAGTNCTYENGHLRCEIPPVLTNPRSPINGDEYTHYTYTCDVTELGDCYILFSQIMANAGTYNPGPPPTFGNPGFYYDFNLDKLTNGTLNCFDVPCVDCTGDCPKKGDKGANGQDGLPGTFRQLREDPNDVIVDPPGDGGGEIDPGDGDGDIIPGGGLLGIGETGTGEIKALTVNPNPAREKVTVSFTSGINGAAKLRITNMQGVELLTETVDCKKGSNKVELNIGAFKPGGYIVTVENKQSTASKQFIKQ